MQIDKIYNLMQLSIVDETLSPWQSHHQHHHTPFMTSLEQQYPNFTLASSLSPTRSKQVYKPKQKNKGNLFQAVKLKGQQLSRWNSATNIKLKTKTPLVSHSQKKWKNEQKKYNFNEEVLIHASTIMNKTSFIPLNINKIDNFSSVRSASARYPRNKNACRIETQGKSWPQKGPEKVYYQQLSTEVSVKGKLSAKQVMNKQWDRSNSMRLNLNRQLNNYMRQQVKLKPVCLKLKFTK